MERPKATMHRVSGIHMLCPVIRPDPIKPPSEGFREWIAIAAGGALGAILRFGFTRALLTQTEYELWLATAASNLIGAFALGLLLARMDEASTPLLRPFLATGVLGSFTTFSTLLLENSTFFQTSPAQSTAHLLGLIGLGLVAFLAGEAIGHSRPQRVS